MAILPEPSPAAGSFSALRPGRPAAKLRFRVGRLHFFSTASVKGHSWLPWQVSLAKPLLASRRGPVLVPEPVGAENGPLAYAPLRFLLLVEAP